MANKKTSKIIKKILNSRIKTIDTPYKKRKFLAHKIGIAYFNYYDILYYGQPKNETFCLKLKIDLNDQLDLVNKKLIIVNNEIEYLGFNYIKTLHYSNPYYYKIILEKL